MVVQIKISKLFRAGHQWPALLIQWADKFEYKCRPEVGGKCGRPTKNRNRQAGSWWKVRQAYGKPELVGWKLVESVAGLRKSGTGRPEVIGKCGRPTENRNRQVGSQWKEWPAYGKPKQVGRKSVESVAGLRKSGTGRPEVGGKCGRSTEVRKRQAGSRWKVRQAYGKPEKVGRKSVESAAGLRKSGKGRPEASGKSGRPNQSQKQYEVSICK